MHELSRMMGDLELWRVRSEEVVDAAQYKHVGVDDKDTAVVCKKPPRMELVCRGNARDDRIDRHKLNLFAL